MTDKGRKTLKIVLLSIIGLTVASFFVHSLMPRELSVAESDGVASILSSLIYADTPLGAFIINNLRKIAHFSEYGVLGIELAIYVEMLAPCRKRGVIASFLFAHATAFIDESLQIISGRGPSIADVWLDMSGFAALFAASLLIAFLIRKIKK